ncbi:hypothetical protein CNEO4_1300005 [Clostridium neonatale]|nr:hypothetical protein CNEO4_1060005 [Clostridium neonatale]CAI3569316.1 hypothetical protein CNEO3_270072 [Clostridium neonatale]CAI3576481.1 hypothetical protein CNEO4_1300005 [Clostridium neonatale]CAI3679124.1 hypothetical protein CNEO4_660027 [Clostridium neonatale]CAI3712660.1 hypothetical protein CNEO4_900005 [Clostridium neonatale]
MFYVIIFLIFYIKKSSLINKETIKSRYHSHCILPYVKYHSTFNACLSAII